MADIQFYEADSDENSESGEDGSLGMGSDGYDSDSSNPDIGLGPLQKLEKYMKSEHTYSRQMVAKNLLETLKLVEETNDAEIDKVLQAMTKLSYDPDGAVQTEVVEQLPSIAVHCREQRQFYSDVVPTYVLPIVVKCLKDCNIQVRKTSQATLIYFAQENLVTSAEIEATVAPVILEMAEPDSIDDFRTEAVMMMTKLAPLIGKEITERVFLTRFAEMCSDALFHVRKVCATNFGDMCHVVGPQITESHLLPKFFYLCEDGVWGVRNACAECFMQVSNACSAEVRREDLSQLFVSLICDQSRWVRMAAFQALGGFISTFANSSLTGLRLNENGQIVISQEKQDLSNCLTRVSSDQDSKVTHISTGDESNDVFSVERTQNSSNCSKSSGSKDGSTCPRCSASTSNTSGGNRTNSNVDSVFTMDVADENTEFSSFNYWRVVPLDLSLGTTTPGKLSTEDNSMASVQSTDECSDASKGGVATTESPAAVDVSTTCQSPADQQGPSEASSCTENSSETREEESSSVVDPQSIPAKCTCSKQSCNSEDSVGDNKQRLLAVTSTTETMNMTSSFSESESSFPQQNIIPRELLDHFLGMVDTTRAQTVDTEIMRHCAYSLPAVAFTLGRENWIYLKDLFDTLVKDMQWKVRRTLAFSLHELAIILGEAITISDLLPTFDDFIKDLDEVRIGILKHLADFLRLLSHDVRRQYLPRITEFLNTDNTRNWRFRMDLAEQLVLVLDLFSPTDIVEHISPVALTLADDKVAQVRYMALNIISGIIKRLSLDVCNHLWLSFVCEIKSRFFQSNHWGGRQLYVRLCGCILEMKSVSNECFATEFMPSLVTLSSDNVPNVRIVLARLLSSHIIPTGYFSNAMNPLQSDLLNIIDKLQNDHDRDVAMCMDQSHSTLTSLTGSGNMTFNSSSN